MRDVPAVDDDIDVLTSMSQQTYAAAPQQTIPAAPRQAPMAPVVPGAPAAPAPSRLQQSVQEPEQQSADEFDDDEFDDGGQDEFGGPETVTGGVFCCEVDTIKQETFAGKNRAISTFCTICANSVPVITDCKQKTCIVRILFMQLKTIARNRTILFLAKKFFFYGSLLQ